MKLDLHYADPRLVELYDRDNPRGRDTDFYLQLADELGAKRIVDLGCGTGLLTRELAKDGREVLGVDPSPAMLAYARRQPGAERVRWLEGGAAALEGTRGFDLAVMTGNVAQVSLEDADWAAALKHLHAALRLVACWRSRPGTRRPGRGRPGIRMRPTSARIRQAGRWSPGSKLSAQVEVGSEWSGTTSSWTPGSDLKWTANCASAPVMFVSRRDEEA